MTPLPRCLLRLLLLLIAPPALAAGPPTRPATTRPAPLRLHKVFLPKTLEFPKGTRRRYAVFLPRRYDEDPNHRWPVILSLHGSGEIGTDGIKQTRVGLPVHIAARPERFPFIAVMPQARTMWFRGEEEAAVWAILEAVLSEYRCDRDRVYITGFSMGGFAAWDLACARPDVFAAAVPICGVANLTLLPNIRNLPVWAFHGRLDKNVPVAGSRDAVAELKRLGAKPRYTEYPDLAHQCWDRAYALSHRPLYRWLLRHRRKKPPRRIEYVLARRAARVWWLGMRAEKNRKAPARIRAEITQDQRVIIESEGIAAWSILSTDKPLKPGTRITVTWNGQSLGEGVFEGRMAFSREPTTATSPAHP